jgi:hypothetical protein
VVDIRVITINIISQALMTEDNVPCSKDGVVFFRITNPEKAVLEVEEYSFAITQLSQSPSAIKLRLYQTLSHIDCGRKELDHFISVP